MKPARLLFKGQDWYLYALCLFRNDFRYFKLSRIKNLEIQDEMFEDSFENLMLNKEMPYKNTVILKVKFDRKVAFRVYDELKGQITEDDDGKFIYRNRDTERLRPIQLYFFIWRWCRSIGTERDTNAD